MQEPGILIVDDVADIVAEMTSMFALVGVPALGADSVDNALRVLRGEPLIRAVICDLHLQHEDGRTLLALLQREPDLASRSLNVIFITGDGGELDNQSAQSPPVTIVRKPIDRIWSLNTFAVVWEGSTMTELALAQVLSSLRRGVNFDVLSEIRFDGDTGHLGFLTGDEHSKTARSVVVNPSDRRDFSMLGGMDEAVIEVRAVEGDRPLHLRLIVERNQSGCAWERGVAIWLSDDDPALAGVADRQRLAHVAMQSAVVAHELRQPLSTIAMAAKSIELMVGQLDQSAIETAKIDHIARAAGRIRVQVERARAIMTDALHEGAAQIHEAHQADLGEAISSAAASLQALCDDNAITLVADIPDSPLLVALPALAVEQVIVNAVHNAVDSLRTARLQGQPGGSVTLRAATRHDMVVCQVIDDGMGLADGTAPDLFQPFFTTKVAVGGVGLGLHISRRIVERAGGTIDLTSNAGRGATLTFALPAKRLSPG